MTHLADFDDSQTWLVPAEDGPDVGWLYNGVAFLDINQDFDLRLPASGEESVLAPVVFNYGLVIRLFEPYAVLVPVTTAEDVSDGDQFEDLIDFGRTNSHYVRLPQLREVWEGDGLALLFQPQTLTTEFLGRPPANALASMSPPAISRLRSRVDHVG